MQPQIVTTLPELEMVIVLSPTMGGVNFYGYAIRGWTEGKPQFTIHDDELTTSYKDARTTITGRMEQNGDVSLVVSQGFMSTNAKGLAQTGRALVWIEEHASHVLKQTELSTTPEFKFLEKAKSLIAEIDASLDTRDLSLCTTLAAVGLDELDCVELIMAFEDEYSTEFSNEEADDVHIFQDLFTLLVNKRAIK